MINDFISSVAVLYNSQGDPKKAYENVYLLITGDAAVDATAHAKAHTLNKVYHSMTAAQQESVASALENGLGGEWDKMWIQITEFVPAASKTYTQKTAAALKVVGLDGTPATPALGATCYQAYKKAVDLDDKKILGFFNRK